MRSPVIYHRVTMDINMIKMGSEGGGHKMSELMPRFRWSGLRNWVIYGAKLRACPSLRLAGFIVEIFNLSNSIRFPLPHLRQRRRGEGGSLCDSSLYLVGCLPPLLIDWMKSIDVYLFRTAIYVSIQVRNWFWIPRIRVLAGWATTAKKKKKKRVRKAISVELWAKHLAHPGKKTSCSHNQQRITNWIIVMPNRTRRMGFHNLRASIEVIVEIDCC